MDRRQALLTTGSMLISASLGAIACGAPKAAAQPAASPPATGGSAPPPAVAYEIFQAAENCIVKGDACIVHCLSLLGGGDTSMAECSKAVTDMKAVMVGLAMAAASNSVHLADLARAAILFCIDCQAACAKHASMHLICKECGEACARTIAACKKLTA